MIRTYLATFGLLSSLFLVTFGAYAQAPEPVIILTPLTDNPKHTEVQLHLGERVFVQRGGQKTRHGGKLKAVVDDDLILQHPLWGERTYSLEEIALIGQKNTLHTIGRVAAFPWVTWGSLLAVLGLGSYLANPDGEWVGFNLIYGFIGVAMAGPASIPFWIPRKKYARGEWDYSIVSQM
ncbi:MAG TPA: hypothetical protein DCP28_27295 [Cytophagales bacterium]|nr:hypothetical protein [Cytophagales bacterium]